LDSKERGPLLYRNPKPLARTEGLLVERIADQTVVYDTESKNAHSFSPLAAAVFDQCDGDTPIDELTQAASERLGEPVDKPKVLAALAQLEERDLLVTHGRGGLSRRDLFRRSAVAGGAAMALPLVTTIVVPTPAAAQTRTCGTILCCPCFAGNPDQAPAGCQQNNFPGPPDPPLSGQQCCEHQTAFQCNCTAREQGGPACKQCKPQQAGSGVACAGLFPAGGGFPPNVNTICPCETSCCDEPA
jgi:Coenzyme PQQ synthesis protein D (PqqD)